MLLLLANQLLHNTQQTITADISRVFTIASLPVYTMSFAPDLGCTLISLAIFTEGVSYFGGSLELTVSYFGGMPLVDLVDLALLLPVSVAYLLSCRIKYCLSFSSCSVYV